jgi:glucose-6-phosphate dehydrogenase assembly protein OpcA
MAPAMIRTHVVGSWSARNTEVESVDAVIRQLRARHRRGQVRTAVASLVVHVGADLVEAAKLIAVVREVAAYNPIRAVVVSTLPDAEPGIDAEVTVLATDGDGGSRVCGETVVLQVRGPAARHLLSVVGPFTLRGVPVVAWFPTQPPHPDDELVAVADRVLVNSAPRDAATAFRVCLELSRRQPVTDLLWVRLEPWRQLLVRLLGGTAADAFASGVRRIESGGEIGGSLLLAGWLMNSLGVASDVVRVIEAEQPTLRLWADHDERHASITVVSDVDTADIRGVALSDAPGSPRRTLVRPMWSPVVVLERALNQPARDAVWEDSVVGALRLEARR